MQEDKKVWLCINRQTKERRLLIEDEAFELDNRLWDFKTWNCNSGHERKAIDKQTTPPVQAPSFAPVGVKCLNCGAYHIRSGNACHREPHVTFAQLHGLA